MKHFLLRAHYYIFLVSVIVRRGIGLYRKGKKMYREIEEMKKESVTKEEINIQKINEFNMRTRRLWRKKYRAEPFRRTVDNFREDIWRTEFENYLKWRRELSNECCDGTGP